MPLFVNSFSFIRLLVICLVSLILINVLVVILYYNGILTGELGSGIYKLFYVDRERNIPSFFNMLLLLTGAILTMYVFLMHRYANFAGRYYWLTLSLLFFFLAFDETVSLHESLSEVLPRYGIGGKGAFTFAWIIPYGLAVCLLAIIFFRFIMALPAQTKRGFIIAGVVFVSGAIGVEMIASKLYDASGGVTESLRFALLSSLEELLEMTGLVMFIYYVLQYASIQLKRLPSKS